jgi:hypothetical protein
LSVVPVVNGGDSVLELVRTRHTTAWLVAGDKQQIGQADDMQRASAAQRPTPARRRAAQEQLEPLTRRVARRAETSVLAHVVATVTRAQAALISNVTGGDGNARTGCRAEHLRLHDVAQRRLHRRASLLHHRPGPPPDFAKYQGSARAHDRACPQAEDCRRRTAAAACWDQIRLVRPPASSTTVPVPNRDVNTALHTSQMPLRGHTMKTPAFTRA